MSPAGMRYPSQYRRTACPNGTGIVTAHTYEVRMMIRPSPGGSITAGRSQTRRQYVHRDNGASPKGGANVDLTGARWFKSSRSETGSQCLEVAFLGGGHIGVRDSKNSTGPALVFTPGEWDAFLGGARDGEFES